MSIFSQDVMDLLFELTSSDVRYLIIGGHAVAFHGAPRSTLDFDIFISKDIENSYKLIEALARFGAPLRAHGVSHSDFQQEGTVYQMGLPPNRIDILTRIDGVSFEDAWTNRNSLQVDGIEIFFISKNDLIKNKSSTSRSKDKLDILILTTKE